MTDGRAKARPERGENEMGQDMQTGRAEAVEELRDTILNALEDYPVDIWGEALGAAVASLLSAKSDAEEIRIEDRARRTLE
jgi:hypothetical protein